MDETDGSGFRPDPDGPGPQDVIEHGSARRFPALEWRPSRASVALGVLALLAGAGAGYTIGVSQAGPSSQRSSLSADSATPALAQSFGGCSAQVGHELQLGEQVTNQSETSVALRKVTAMLPLGGLQAVSEQWGPCGVFPSAQEQPGSRLAPGASTWFTVTFKVLTRCPQPDPVQFTIDYEAHGQPVSEHLPGFPDLGEVTYSGCSPQ